MTLALTLDHATGQVCGDLRIEYNTPFPCRNGTPGVTGAMRGVVMHTVAGTYAGCIATFNDPGRQASAHFVVAGDGRVCQFGPIGKGWAAWHAAAANRAWYGIEHEDFGHPELPLTDAQLTASAQLVEFLSRFAGFPLQVTDDCDGRGLAYHAMCAGWNPDHHACPGAIRIRQRGEIIYRARQIRRPQGTPVQFTADGHLTWAQIAARFGLRPEHLVWQTAMHQPGGFGALEARAIGVLASAVPPQGTVLWAGKYPARASEEERPQ